MNSRVRVLAAGLAGIAVLLAVLVGLPVVLYRFGGFPLPAHPPSWRHIVTLLGNSDQGTVLLAAIRACSWLAWLLFALCVLAEALAAIRGRNAPHLRLGGLQGAAAYLVGLAALTFAAPSAITLTASVTPALQAAAVATRVPAADRLATVHAGDCLWSLAQHYLGNGDLYTEIVSLNEGREMGHGQVFADPAFIEPGWQLLLPLRAGAVPVQLDTARHHLGHPTADPHYRRRHPVARNQRGYRPTGNPSGNGAAHPDAARSEGLVSARGKAADGTGHDEERAAGQNPANDGQLAIRLSEVAAFVTGALAGAILASIGRLRNRQRQVRRRGRRIPLPADPAVLATEARLRATAQAEPLASLRDVLACLEAGILGSGHESPDIIGLHVTTDVLEVLLATPAAGEPPAPFVVTAGRQGMCWHLDLPAAAPALNGAASSAVRSIADLDCHLLPGLVTAGATGTGYLLLDLEALCVVGCDGPSDLVDRVVTTAAAELATGQWSGWYDLILVGCDELAELGRADHCESLDDALELLAGRSATVERRLADRAQADVRDLRLTEPDDEDWGLTILVSRVEPSATQMARLLQLTDDGPGGIAALIAGDPESADGRMAPAVLQLAPDPDIADGIIANLAPLQITVRPRVLSSADYDAIGSLLASAGDLVDVGPDHESYLVYDSPPWIPQAANLGSPSSTDGEQGQPVGGANATHEADHFAVEAEVEFSPGPSPASSSRLEVNVLGPFTITGSAEALQPKQAELVLALALAAPAGLSNSALCSMLGADPDHPKPSDSIRQVITRTRRRLGIAGDGREYILHAGGGQYLLHPQVTLDWTRFRELVASGRADDIRRAMALIRGQPFTGSYFWWIDIPLIETVRAELVDAADTLAEFELAIGSPRAAARAAHAGLMAEPSAEQLWRAVMRAEHAAGNLAGVCEAWRRCLAAIEDVALDGEPHADTAALYRQLTTPERQHVHVR